MLKAGAEIICDTAIRHIVKNAVDTYKIPSEEEMSEEQRVLEKRVRFAQNVLGIVCPPAAKAMFALEYGPIIAADIIYKVYESDAAKCLGGWATNCFQDLQIKTRRVQ